MFVARCEVSTATHPMRYETSKFLLQNFMERNYFGSRDVRLIETSYNTRI
jgi:hypothetical protein